jgi:predicted porin
MNKKLGLAVAGALLAASASANAGITIPAGDWTVDIGGNVNAFYIHNNSKDTNTINGGLANGANANGSGASSINTGLLPSWLTIGAKTRQNDLDVAWAISFQPGASSKTSLGGGGGSEFRQAYFTFGDASWGTVKVGKDLGQFGQDAILSDMTLLGVGSQGAVGTAGGTTTTLGRIGTGYMYADFNGQINYTSPSWNGFSFTAGIAQPLNTLNLDPYSSGAAAVSLNASIAQASAAAVAATGSSGASAGAQQSPAFEAVARYAFTADQVTGKVWAEVKTQDVKGIGSGKASEQATAYGIGANVAAAGFTLTGYYYSAEGAGTTAWLMDGFDSTGHKRDSDGGYVQATYVLPTATKVGASWGISNLDKTATDVATSSKLVKENEMWTVGVYHPLTKSVNLVAEYSNVKSRNQADQENQSDIVSLGGILFF